MLELVARPIHSKVVLTRRRKHLSVLCVAECHIIRGAETLEMHRLLQSLLERQLTDKKHTRPVRTAPLPVDQVPGWREALVTTWAKVEAERTRATTSGRSFGNMS